MASQYTTHQLANKLEEICNALRELPDISLSDFQSPRSKKAEVPIELTEIANSLPRASKEETEQLLNKQSQKNLIQICRHLKINIGSNKKKKSLIDELVWHFYGAQDELELIRNYDESR